MDEGVIRQRRNLVGICLATLLYIFAGGDLSSILGVSISKPEIAELFVVLGFFYFLWRYWIYSRGEVSMMLLRAIVDYDTLGSINGSSKRYGIGSSLNKKEGKWVLTVTENVRTGQSSTGEIQHTIPGAMSWLAFIKKLLVLSFTESKFSDFIFPYILAIATMIVGILQFFLQNTKISGT